MRHVRTCHHPSVWRNRRRRRPRRRVRIAHACHTLQRRRRATQSTMRHLRASWVAVARRRRRIIAVEATTTRHQRRRRHRRRPIIAVAVQVTARFQVSWCGDSLYFSTYRPHPTPGRGSGYGDRLPGELLDDDLDDLDDFDDDDDFATQQPRKTAAELLEEERQHKARRVARIEQLEALGIKCSLPDDVEWMSLPLSQIDDAMLLMETMKRRKERILKMRAGVCRSVACRRPVLRVNTARTLRHQSRHGVWRHGASG